jgi:uncharacterized protein (TIRG00374 family)
MLPGIIISLVALALVLYFVDLKKVLAALQQADYRYLPLVLVVYLLSLFARAAAWRTLLQEQVDYVRTFFLVNAGYFLNSILPFRLGEVGRAFLVSQNSPVSFWEAASTILIERAFDMMLSVSLILATLPFVVALTLSPEAASWALPAALSVGSVVLLALLFLHLLARNRLRALGWLEKLAEHRPWLGRLVKGRLEAFFTGLAALTDISRFLKTLGWLLLNWFLWVSEYYLLMLAIINKDAPFLWAAFAMAVAAMGVAIPSSPGGIGVVEASVVGALAVLGVDPSPALAFALSMHFIYLATTAILGTIGLAREGESLERIYQRITNRQT